MGKTTGLEFRKRSYADWLPDFSYQWGPVYSIDFRVEELDFDFESYEYRIGDKVYNEYSNKFQEDVNKLKFWRKING